MRELIDKRYGKKGNLYQEVVEILDMNFIRYELVNFIIPDTKPGDLDIMINREDLPVVCRELTCLGFEYYTKFNSNQYIWNKFIRDEGFVQIHLYVGLSFWNYDFLEKIPTIENNIDRLHLSFLVYLVESMFRKNIKDDIFDTYTQSVVLKDFRYFCAELNYVNIDFIDAALLANRNREYISKFDLLKLLKFPIIKHLFYVLFKIQSKVKRFLNSEDEIVLVLGVDGSGKSTLVNELCRMCSKGGIFPKKLYLGIRQSLVHRSILYLKAMYNGSELTMNTAGIKLSNSRHSSALKTTIMSIKVVALWIEYNLRLIKQIYLIPNSARTIYLVDRSYLDIVLFYPQSWIRALFIRGSIVPSKIIYLHGNEEMLCERSGECSVADIKESNNIYLQLLSQFKSSDVLTLDTTKNSIDDCKYKSIEHILNGE